MSRTWFWRGFLIAAILWNIFGGVQMLAMPDRFLGGFAAMGPPYLFLSLCGLFLLVFAAATALILISPDRFWPLAWLAAIGRMGAGAMMLDHWRQGFLSDQIIFPGVVDVAFGIGFLLYAIRYAARPRAATA